MYAQLNMYCNGKRVDFSTINAAYIFKKNTNFTTDSLPAIADKNWQKVNTGKLETSFKAQSIWLKISLQEITKYGNYDLVEVDNPHINFLKFWIIQNDTIVEESKLTGDNTIFSTRPLPTTTFVMPITTIKSGYLVIVINKEFSKLEIPIYFSSQGYYLHKTLKKNLALGFFVGFLFLLCCINLGLYISVRESLYIWHSVYLFIVACYVIVNEGILFKLLYPNYTFLNDVLRPGLLLISTIPLFIFINKLLQLKKVSLLIYKINVKVLIAFFILLSLGIISSVLLGHETQGVWLKISQVISPLIYLYLLIQIIYFCIIKIPYAYFALASITGFNVLGILFVLGQKELINENIFTTFATYYAILYESTVMLVALIWRYRTNKINVETELKALEKKQQSIYKEIAIWQEKETIRFSSLLHDSVGANLAFLRLEADNMSLTEDSRVNLATNITTIANEVRNMSHTFSPILLNTKGLYESIEEKVKLINTNSTIHLLFEWFEETKKLNPQYEMIVYRIVQEILQNLLKHSKANHGLLQIILNQNFVSIYAEDDGIGFDQKQNKGLGLQSIENLVQLLNGTFRIESSINDGFNISIEFNLPKDGKI